MDELPDALDIPQVTWAGVATGAVALLLAALLAWLVRTVVRRLLVWRGRSENSADVFARLLGLVILAFGFGAALTIVFPSVRPVDILGGLGVLSIAAGIAFQTVLGNVFAGIVILARDLYRVGDQVRVGEHAGTIVTMRLTSTTVRTFDGRLVLLPNGLLHSEPVTVQTGYEYVRSSITVEIDGATGIDRACTIAERAMRDVPEVLADPPPKAMLAEIGAATVVIDLLFWSGARQMETREARHAVITRVMADFAEAGIVLATDAHIIEAGPQFSDALRARPPASAAGAEQAPEGNDRLR